MNSLSSTQSFTKDIYSRMKQISADLLQLKKENNELHNKNLTSLEERLSRLEIIVETKLNIIIEKLDSQDPCTSTNEQTDDLLLEKLDDLNIITSPIISSSPKTIEATDNLESNNIEQIEQIEQINFDKFFKNNLKSNNMNLNNMNLNNTNNIEKKEKISINNIDDILIL